MIENINNPSIPSQVIAKVTFPKYISNLGIIPTSYKDSMSYYEILAWFCKYLEEVVVPTVNENGEAVEELQALYVELHNYVEHYFDNLDVQQEINNKLDAMTEDGTLTNLIKDYVDPIYQAYETSINEHIAQQDSLIASSLASNPIFVSSTTDMTNQNKIYVLSSNGHIYAYDNGNFIDTGVIYGNANNTFVDMGLVTSANYETVLPDANDITTPSIYKLNFNRYSTTITANLPYGTSGYTGHLDVLVTFMQNNSSYATQLLFSDNVIYKRTKGVTWGSWSYLLEPTNTYMQNYGVVTSSNYTNYFTDANDINKNSIYMINMNYNSTTLLNLPFTNFKGQIDLLYTYIGTYPRQIYIYRNFEKIFDRHKISGVWSAWEDVTPVKPTKKITVDSNGTGDYTSLTEAVFTNKDILNAEYYVKNGTYDLITEYKAYFGNDCFDNGVPNDGLPVKNHQKFYLEPNAVVSLDNTSNVITTDKGRISCFVMEGLSGEIHGGTIIGKNCRYSIHDDVYGYNTVVSKSVIDNVNIISDHVAIGGGFGLSSDIQVKNCTISGTNMTWAIFYHAGTEATNLSSRLVIKNNYCSQGNIIVESIGTTNNISTALVCNNKANKLTYVNGRTDGGNHNIQLYNYNNDVVNPSLD